MTYEIDICEFDMFDSFSKTIQADLVIGFIEEHDFEYDDINEIISDLKIAKQYKLNKREL